MNNPSPLVPQGTQPPRGKSSLYFKILMILTVHVVLIGGMLLQGCKDTGKEQAKDPSISQAGGDMMVPSNSIATADTTIPPVNTATMSNQAMATLPSTQSAVTPVTSAPTPAYTGIPSPAVPVAATVATGDGRDYVIAKGDTMGAIARRNSISVKALMDANPGVSPKKLRIGQKLLIPASMGAMAATSTSTSSGAVPAEATSDGATYTVKSGDTLGKIARAHGTSYKKIMALNNLTTTGIRVGQKLKLPAGKTASAEPAPAAAASIAPTPGPISSVSTPATGVAN
jgi:LysM repeat protein